MDITFTGQYKSITAFEWRDIPNFVVLTGPNGSGKSQLLQLIHNTIIDKKETKERVSIKGRTIKKEDVIFLHGEWNLSDTSNVDLATIKQKLNAYFNNIRQQNFSANEGNIQMFSAVQNILEQTGKKHLMEITKEEFESLLPEMFMEQTEQMSNKIGEVFYNYRLGEIDRLADGISESQIRDELGEKPWVVLREILAESKLPFLINDPANHRIRDSFKFELTHAILGEKINFRDLSSGERVLISLVFYLYSSREKNVFPRLFLLDEPDAHLHPSMSRQFLDVIKNVLVDKYGVQVIMTTHSPSTVILAPSESIYEMSINEPRIRKGTSKNHCVALLTEGLVFVGEGTKYILVEDQSDVKFYSYIHGQMVTEGIIDSEIPVVFIPASEKREKPGGGGKEAVKTWVSRLRESAMLKIIQGLIDSDNGNEISDGIYKIDRYSIENYLIDPILIYAVLLDIELAPKLDEVNLSLGDERKLLSLSDDSLQKIADHVFQSVRPLLPHVFPDFDPTEDEQEQISFTSGHKLLYPKWLRSRAGKDLLNQAFQKKFGSRIHFDSLFRMMRKLNIFSLDLRDKFNEIKQN